MKQLLAIIAAITTAVQAERIDIGGYFSVDVPDSWRKDASGVHVNSEGAYPVFAAFNPAHTSVMVVTVENAPTEGISFAEYESYTEDDMSWLAEINHRVGWTFPKVRKMHINGIPALCFNQQQGKEYMLCMNLWIDGKRFRVTFAHTLEGTKLINHIIDSIRAEKVLIHPSIQAAIQSGNIGDF